MKVPDKLRYRIWQELESIDEPEKMTLKQLTDHINVALADRLTVPRSENMPPIKIRVSWQQVGGWCREWEIPYRTETNNTNEAIDKLRLAALHQQQSLTRLADTLVFVINGLLRVLRADEVDELEDDLRELRTKVSELIASNESCQID